VVTAGEEILGEAAEEPAPVVRDQARLAVDELPRGSDLAAERLDQGLVSETDPQSPDAGREPSHDLDRGSGLARPAGTGGDD
jgi:hypothetical protein